MSTQYLGNVELLTKQEVEAMLNTTVVTEAAIDTKINNSEAEVDTKINTVKTELEGRVDAITAQLGSEVTERTDKQTALGNRLDTEATTREESDRALTSRIEREEGTREAAITQVTSLVESEALTRQQNETRMKQNIEELQARIDPATTQMTELIGTEKQERIAGDASLQEVVADLTTKYNNLKAIKSDVFEDKVFAFRLTNLPIAQITIENTDKSIKVGDTIGSVSEAYLPKTPVTFSFITEVEHEQTDPEDSGYAFLSVRLGATGDITVINKTMLTEKYTGNINSGAVTYITKE